MATQDVLAGAPRYPFPPDGVLDPPAEFRELRTREPISRVQYVGAPAWLLTRYEDVRAVLTDRRFVPYLPGIPIGEDADDAGVLFLMNGPRHARLRRVVAGAFSARRVAALRPAVARLASARLAELRASGPPADLVGAYAVPLAVGALSELLGVEIADRPDFAAWSEGVTALFGTSAPEDLVDSGERLGEFIGRLVAAKRSAPGPDLVSALVEARDAEGEPLRDGEVLGVVSSLLLAGFVPPAQSLALGALRLLLDPAAAAVLRGDPALLPRAVDELLRLDPAGAGSSNRTMRAVEDVELGDHQHGGEGRVSIDRAPAIQERSEPGTDHQHGVHVRRGDVVIAPFGAANRDPSRFPEPDRLDPARADNPHLSFAPGPHHCLGAALARMELEVGIGALLPELPELPALALAADVAELAWRTGLTGERNLVALPVTWPS